MQYVLYVLEAVVNVRSLYELDLMKVTPDSGFYRITISLTASQPSDLKLIGTSGAEVYQQFIFKVSLSSARQHLTCGGCLEFKREY